LSDVLVVVLGRWCIILLFLMGSWEYFVWNSRHLLCGMQAHWEEESAGAAPLEPMRLGGPQAKRGKMYMVQCPIHRNRKVVIHHQGPYGSR
jgi:hypothetical protein